jgi:serine/threonine-protein kinase
MTHSDSADEAAAQFSADDWAHLKSVWFAVESASFAEQQLTLDSAALPAHVRHRLDRMLAAASRLNSRFDTPAPIAMGLERAGAPTAGGALVGQRLGPYRVVRLVGRGGMGAVYEAERDDAQYRQRVAIKTIWRGADSDVLLQRFRSERQILAALQHPNIAQLVDGGATESGTPWLAMEFVEGMPLDEYCDTKQLSLSARLDLFRQVCHAVHHAHQRLVVHRDLKPSNVLVTADGTVKLLDFGVAKLLDDAGGEGTLTGAGLSPFTAAYAAPEQANGEMASMASDVYALGAMLCTLLASAPPLDLAHLDPITRLVAVRDGTPRVPSVIARGVGRDAAIARGFDSPRKLSAALDGELDAIVLCALRRDPSKRYPNVLALSDDVRRYLRRDRVLARQGTLAYRTWAFTRRHRTLVFGSTFALVCALGVSLMSLRQARSLRDEAARAERAAAFMAGIMSGPTSMSQDAALQVGPGGTVGQLLDSAVTRVPREFPHDARIRARLYIAFGTNYAAQSRYARARAVLDSARVLAAQGYGTQSEQYARASFEAASLELAYHGPNAATDAMRAVAENPTAASPDSPLGTRLVLLRAQQEFNRGNMRAADSLARNVIAVERLRRGLTTVVATAECVRLGTTSWITRDPRDHLRRARALEAITDSLGMTYSAERDQAADAEVESLLVLGRADSAEARIRTNLQRLRQAFGGQPTVQVWAAQSDALLASLRGDSIARRQALARGRHILDSADVMALPGRLVFSSAYVDDALARKDYPAALQMSLATRNVMLPSRSPLYLSFAHLYVGAAHLALGDAVAAEADFRAGLAVIAPTRDLASMAPRLRRPLAEALSRQGRLIESDSVRRLDPPKAAVPPCTPGGRWAGCPDR